VPARSEQQTPSRTRHGRRPILLLAATALIPALAVPAVLADESTAHGAITVADRVPADQPELGLRYAGLVPAKDGEPCYGLYRVADTGTCSHGPDAPPPGLAVDRDVAPVAVPGQVGTAAPDGHDHVHHDAGPTAKVPEGTGFTTTAGEVVCDGDGVTGQRVQVLYVRGADTPSRFAEYLESFRTWAAGVDTIYDASAQETGGSRHIRFVTTPECTVDVREAEVPAASIGGFSETLKALRALGYNRTDRKYMLFADANV
jgi:hypothetical protein